MFEPTFTAPPPPPPPFPAPEGQKQSKIGIASFVIALVALLLFCVGFILSFGYGFTLAMNNPNFSASSIDRNSPMVVIATGLFFCSPVIGLIGSGLGIASIIQKTDKKTFGIIGLVINSLIILSLCVLFVIGLMG
jgi:hypothetical protein